MNITCCTADKVYGKVPFSNKNSFNFFNIETSILSVNELFKTFFILSLPLKSDIETQRNTESLIKHYDFNQGWILLDIDKVQNIDSIVNYFKDYSVNIFWSYSFNGNTNLNLKAILEVQGNLNFESYKNTLLHIREDLKNYCQIDVSSSRPASYQSKIKDPSSVYKNQGEKYNLVHTNSNEIKREIKTLDSSIQRLCKDIFEGNGVKFKNFKNPNGSFQASIPGEKSPWGYFWQESSPYVLYHNVESKNVNIFKDVQKSKEYKDYISKKQETLFYDTFEVLKSDKTVNSKYFNPQDISKEIDEFLNTNSVLKVRGGMNTGKSNVVKELLERSKDKNFLFVTPRRSLSLDISQKYNIHHYDDLQTYETGSLVIQIDSLHKINPDNFDYFILDEFMSLLIYISSKLKEDKNLFYKSTGKLLNIMNKKLVLIDAFLSNWEDNEIFFNRNIIRINNSYKDQSKLFLYNNLDTLVHKMKAEEDVFTVSCNSVKDADAIKEILSSNGIKSVLIKGESSENFKKIIQENMSKKKQDLWKALIFTPTITVGVSIMNESKSHYHFDSGTSIDIISSLQMLKRNRQASEIHCYFKSQGKKYQATSSEETIKIIENNLKKFMKTHLVNYEVDRLNNLGVFYDSNARYAASNQ